MANNYYCIGTPSGEGVIEALINKGGINHYGYTGDHEGRLYYIRPDNNFIDFVDTDDINSEPLIVVIKAWCEEVPHMIPRNINGTYYCIATSFGKPYVKECTDCNTSLDTERHINYNYYLNKETCQKTVDDIIQIIKNSHNL